MNLRHRLRPARPGPARWRTNAYNLGIAGGDRDQAVGLSYTWTRGAEASFGDQRQLTLGSVHRWRLASLGLSTAYDFAADNALYQADLGAGPGSPAHAAGGRPSWIPRAGPGTILTTWPSAFGLEARLLPGLDLAALARDTGELSLRLDLAWGGGGSISRPERAVAGARVHLDDDQEHAATTYSLETGVGPHLGLQFGRGERYPELHLQGPIAYRSYRFFDERRRLLPLLSEPADDAVDPGVAGVVLDLSSLRSHRPTWELRAQLAGLRAAGKKVIIYFDRATYPGTCWPRWPTSCGWIPTAIWHQGGGLGRSYYRRMLDKMGVGIDEWRFFTYKSAMETLSRTSMSDADREQFQAFMEDWVEEAVSLILEARPLDRGSWDALVNSKAELIPAEALAAGLVDKIGDFHTARDQAAQARRRPGGDRVAAELGSLFGERVWGAEAWGEPPASRCSTPSGPAPWTRASRAGGCPGPSATCAKTRLSRPW